MINLYEFALSGNCHKVRLLLSLLGLEYHSIIVNGSERQQKSAEFTRLNLIRSSAGVSGRRHGNSGQPGHPGVSGSTIRRQTLATG